MSASTEGDDRRLDDNIGAEVSSELKKKARVAAAMENKNLSQWLRDVLEEATDDVDV